MDRKEVIEACGKHWNPTAAVMFKLSKRTIEERAEGNWVYDEDGNCYLDFACSYGVFIVGHGNPCVRARALEQLSRLPSAPSGMLEPARAELMAHLGRMLPGDLKRIWLTNSGAEASELSLRAALAYNAPRRRVVVAQNSYHGKTLGALGILGQPGHRAPFGRLMKDVVFVPYGDAGAMREAVDETIAAVFLEPVLGGAYLQVPEAGYVGKVAEYCQQAGALLVADEIQTAFGRAGRMFAVEYDGVVPDMIILSKGMTGGHASIAATVMREEIAQRLHGMQGLSARYLASDSGGSPYACAAAVAALEFIEEEDLPGRAVRVGAALRAGLARAKERYPKLILDAPGIGMMTGLKMRNPAAETALTMAMGKRGIHVAHSMNETARHPVLRFYPPLTVGEAEITFVLEALEDSLRELDKKSGFSYDVFNQVVKRLYRIPPPLLYRLSGVSDG